MRFELDLDDALAGELDQMVKETTGMGASAIAGSILTEYLRPRIAARATQDDAALLAAVKTDPDLNARAVARLVTLKRG